MMRTRKEKMLQNQMDKRHRLIEDRRKLADVLALDSSQSSTTATAFDLEEHKSIA